MNEIKFKQEISHAICSSNLEESKNALVRFQSSGGEQQVAYDVVMELSGDDAIDSDLVYDVLDIISGWCPPHQRIWGSELRNGVRLFKISRTDLRKDGNLALFPGVSQSLIERCKLGNVRQGTMIELRSADGRRITRPITDYFVRVPTEPDEKFDVSGMSVVICISSETSEDVKVGMEVWSLDE